ncbi:MAG: hypothetical protein AB4058_17525 [Microcystaceae cyanobacterium]
MTLSELIYQKMTVLSDDEQQKVLTLINRMLGQKPDQENQDWNQFSLEQAMQGLEDDNLPDYTEDDLREKWQ